MLGDYFTEEQVCLDSNADTPEKAIEAAGQLLYGVGKIQREYIDSMIDTYHQLGPYMVIAPGIAIPHGQPGKLVLEDCICFCRLKNSVDFGHDDNDPVKFVFAIGGHASGGHLDLLRELSMFLMGEGNIKKLEKVKTKKEFLELIGKGGK